MCIGVVKSHFRIGDTCLQSSVNRIHYRTNGNWCEIYKATIYWRTKMSIFAPHWNSNYFDWIFHCDVSHKQQWKNGPHECIDHEWLMVTTNNWNQSKLKWSVSSCILIASLSIGSYCHLVVFFFCGSMEGLDTPIQSIL